MITPAIMGFIPTPATSLRLVFNPIAANAIDKENFDRNDIPSTILSGTRPVLLMPTTARNPRINHGNILPMFTFSVACDGVSFFVYIHEKISTIGTMKSVLVSLTIVAREPAASENAYDYAGDKMLDFRHETFLTLCSCNSFTKAAELLHITQPAVSQHIKHLEDFYGCKLFDTANRKSKTYTSRKAFARVCNDCFL